MKMIKISFKHTKKETIIEYVWDLNTDTNTRDQILFGENFDETKYPGGIRSFEDLPAATMKKLLELNFAN